MRHVQKPYTKDFRPFKLIEKFLYQKRSFGPLKKFWTHFFLAIIFIYYLLFWRDFYIKCCSVFALLDMLSKKELKEIITLFDELKSKAAVARRLGHSRQTVHDVIAGGLSKRNKKMGRPRKIDRHQKIAIKKCICDNIGHDHLMTSRHVKADCQLDASLPTTRREIKSLGFAYKFVDKQLPLTKAHKAARLRFAEKHLTDQTDWTKIVFSVEKKFRKDGRTIKARYMISILEPKPRHTASSAKTVVVA